MRVRVTITVELKDPEQWTTTFGVEGADKIRQDVKSYLGNEAQQAGVFGNGEVDAEISWS